MWHEKLRRCWWWRGRGVCVCSSVVEWLNEGVCVTLSRHLELMPRCPNFVCDFTDKVLRAGSYPSLTERGAVLFRRAPRPRAAALVYCCKKTCCIIFRGRLSRKQVYRWKETKTTKSGSDSCHDWCYHEDVNVIPREPVTMPPSRHSVPLSGHNGWTQARGGCHYWSKRQLSCSRCYSTLYQMEKNRKSCSVYPLVFITVTE